MNKVISMVREFHETFGHPTGKDGLPTGNRMLQRLEYKQSEHLEMLTAILADDPIELFDAVGDIAYLAAGDLVEFGLKDAAPIKINPEEEFSFDFLSDNLLKAYTTLHFTLGEVIVCAANGGDQKRAIFLSSYLLTYCKAICMKLAVDFEALMTEIHSSNMSKLWPEDEATRLELLTESGRKIDDVTFVASPVRPELFVCYDAVTQKVVKNPRFRHPDVAQFI